MVNAHWSSGEEVTLFVSPKGSDAHPGAKMQPFKTLEAARDVMRKADRAEKGVVWLRAGVYERDKPFRLTSEDSGSPSKPVVYRAWPSEAVKLLEILYDEPAAPKGNLVARNISHGGRWDGVRSEARSYVTFRDNLVNEDPHFKGTPPETFELREESPAYKLGFRPIPFERIGLQNDAYRTVPSL